MPSSSAALGLLPPSALQRLMDGLHLDLAQRLRPARFERAVLVTARMSNRLGKCSSVNRARRRTGSTACSITLASSRTLPGQGCRFKRSSAVGREQRSSLGRTAAEARAAGAWPARNVVGPLAQGRQMNLERVDAEHQVFAKISFLDHLLQVAMRGADRPARRR